LKTASSYAICPYDTLARKSEIGKPALGNVFFNSQKMVNACSLWDFPVRTEVGAVIGDLLERSEG